MPRVPELPFVRADASVLVPGRADTSVDSPDLAAIPGRQLEQSGRAMLGLGNAALEIATRMQQDVNTSRVTDSRNQLSEIAQSLAFDPQTGYLTQKGYSALKRENGMSLADEYGQKLQQTISDLSGKLDNDEQRRQFMLRAGDTLASFRGGIEQHVYQEWKHYSLSAQDGALKVAADEAKRNWNDPLKIDTALQDADAAVVRAGQLQGDSATEILAKRKIASSHVHLGVIDAALQNNNPTYAHQYLQRYKEGMTADDILKVNGALNRDLDARISQTAVQAAVQEFAPRFEPTDTDRLKGIVAGMESNGKDYGADGAPLMSPKGAKYRMQVMPDTAKNPGFGIRPARDDSAAEYNRVGEQYLDAMVRKYGSTAQAMAAYNAGPDVTDAALKQAQAAGAPETWLAYLPKETQSYVRNGVSKLGTGAGAAPAATIMEFVQNALDRLGPSPRPEQVKLTREAAEHQYNLITKSIGERRDQTMKRGLHALIANGGDYNALDPNLKAAIAQDAPGKLDDVLRFAKAIRKGDAETDPTVYYGLRRMAAEDPGQFAKIDLLASRDRLAPADWKHLVELQGGISKNDLKAMAQQKTFAMALKAVDADMKAAGIDTTPKEGSAPARDLAQFKTSLLQALDQAQQAKGAPLSFEDARKIGLDQLKQGWLQGSGIFFDTKERRYQVTPEQQKYPFIVTRYGDIPAQHRSTIEAGIRAKGREPSKGEVERTYQRAIDAGVIR